MIPKTDELPPEQELEGIDSPSKSVDESEESKYAGSTNLLTSQTIGKRISRRYVPVHIPPDALAQSKIVMVTNESATTATTATAAATIESDSDEDSSPSKSVIITRKSIRYSSALRKSSHALPTAIENAQPNSVEVGDQDSDGEMEEKENTIDEAESGKIDRQGDEAENGKTNNARIRSIRYNAAIDALLVSSNTVTITSAGVTNSQNTFQTTLLPSSTLSVEEISKVWKQECSKLLQLAALKEWNWKEEIVYESPIPLYVPPSPKQETSNRRSIRFTAPRSNQENAQVARKYVEEEAKDVRNKKTISFRTPVKYQIDKDEEIDTSGDVEKVLDEDSMEVSKESIEHGEEGEDDGDFLRYSHVYKNTLKDESFTMDPILLQNTAANSSSNTNNTNPLQTRPIPPPPPQRRPSNGSVPPPPPPSSSPPTFTKPKSLPPTPASPPIPPPSIQPTTQPTSSSFLSSSSSLNMSMDASRALSNAEVSGADMSALTISPDSQSSRGPPPRPPPPPLSQRASRRLLAKSQRIQYADVLALISSASSNPTAPNSANSSPAVNTSNASSGTNNRPPPPITPSPYASPNTILSASNALNGNQYTHFTRITSAGNTPNTPNTVDNTPLVTSLTFPIANSSSLFCVIFFRNNPLIGEMIVCY